MTTISAERKRALAARRRLGVRKRQTASRRICRRAARLPVVRRARRIGLYWPLASETDPRGLLPRLDAAQSVYLPRVVHQELIFVPVNPAHFRHTQSNLGVIEPAGGPRRRVSTLDLLIVPLAAFDRHGHRIGLGGGFYDRTLAASHGNRRYRRPTLLGMAFEAQHVDRVDIRPWDIVLDMVVTESHVYR